MPLDPPVMTATLPSSFPIEFSVSRHPAERCCCLFWSLNRAKGSRPQTALRTSREHRASDLADAAVCHQIRARHIRTLVRPEKDSRIRDFHGLCKTADGDHVEVHLHHLVPPCRLRLRVENRSISHARAEGVDA